MRIENHMCRPVHRNPCRPLSRMPNRRPVAVQGRTDIETRPRAPDSSKGRSGAQTRAYRCKARGEVYMAATGTTRAMQRARCARVHGTTRLVGTPRLIHSLQYKGSPELGGADLSDRPVARSPEYLPTRQSSVHATRHAALRGPLKRQSRVRPR